MSEVHIREVGPRDGLQVEAPIPVEDRVRLVDALAAAGLRSIEATAFVSPKAVPAMAGAAEVMAALEERAHPGVRYSVLVPNAEGARRATFCQEVTFTLSASPGYNERNVRMSIDRSVEELAVAVSVLAPRGIPVDAVVSCAFGSPFEGDIDPAAVHALGSRLLEVGVASLTYADTTGMATPRRIADLVALTGPGVGLHLHDTRGTALVNAYAAWELGVHRFDTAVGGLGGSPAAPAGGGKGAGGNLATEDLVHLLADLGVDTGVDLDQLLDASALAASLVGHPVPSRVASAGPRGRLAVG
ncbi:MAG TPA: hydroxymethylglutaryl-CoA lyase [Acidimicrobiales bacterium]|nr:hydroxymethylglutaryl-CoA lyase [Acidimicrobiales bacterium]